MSSSDLTPHRGTMILVLGILGLVFCQFISPIAWVMGKGDVEKMDSGQMDPEGRGLTQAGMVCGIVGTILLILGFLGFLVFLVFVTPVAISEAS